MLDTRSRLPEDVFRDDDGKLMRLRLRFRGYVNADGEPWTEADGPKFEAHDEVPHPCLVGSPDDTEEDLADKRHQAIRLGADFWHPRHGWLRLGRKREQEHPENLGDGVKRYQRRIRPVEADDAAEPAPTSRRGARRTEVPPNGP